MDITIYRLINLIMESQEYMRLLGKARDAKQGGHSAWCVQSTGEQVAVALTLNRADWLAEAGFTIAEAIDRAGETWVSLIPRVAKELSNDH
jgi:hypothetical protein